MRAEHMAAEYLAVFIPGPISIRDNYLHEAVSLSKGYSLAVGTEERFDCLARNPLSFAFLLCHPDRSRFRHREDSGRNYGKVNAVTLSAYVIQCP